MLHWGQTNAGRTLLSTQTSKRRSRTKIRRVHERSIPSGAIGNRHFPRPSFSDHAVEIASEELDPIWIQVCFRLGCLWARIEAYFITGRWEQAYIYERQQSLREISYNHVTWKQQSVTDQGNAFVTSTKSVDSVKWIGCPHHLSVVWVRLIDNVAIYRRD